MLYAHTDDFPTNRDWSRSRSRKSSLPECRTKQRNTNNFTWTLLRYQSLRWLGLYWQYQCVHEYARCLILAVGLHYSLCVWIYVWGEEQIYTQDGKLIAVTTQEGVVRADIREPQKELVSETGEHNLSLSAKLWFWRVNIVVGCYLLWYYLLWYVLGFRNKVLRRNEFFLHIYKVLSPI